MAAELAVKQDGQGRRRSSNMEGTIKVMQALVTQYEFSHCIVEHNLEDENEQLLNFSTPETLKALDPRVGDEISQLIDRLNQFEMVDLGE
jgi:hypothetical protein